MHDGRTRLAQLGLVAAALLFAVALGPSSAGTAADPEITDGANDQGLQGQSVCPAPGTPPAPAPPACTGGAADILAAWITAETATTIEIHVNLSSAPAFINQYNNFWTVGMTYAGTDLKAGASWMGGATATTLMPTGIATAASVNGTKLVLVVPKSAFAASLPKDAALVNLFATTARNVFGANQTLFGDRAPDGEAFGRSYTFKGTSSSPPTGKPGDSDGDGLDNTFEAKYFGSASSNQTATGDPDGDGCDNACEQKSGTDPTKADTDGDGISDNDELKAGSDPKDPASPGGSTTAPPSSTTPPPSTSSGGTSPPPTSGATGGAPTTKDSCPKPAASCFTEGSNTGYTVAAIGLFVVVLAVCLVALLGRWSI